MNGFACYTVSDAPLLYNSNFSVVDESDDWIVLDKPAHLLCHPSKPGNPPTLWDGLRHLLSFDLANGAQLSIITRLDRDTSGLVLVAKTPEMAREFSIAMQQGKIGKEYLALVWGWPELDEWICEEPIRRQGEFQETRIWLKQAVHPEGRECRTRFQVLKRWEKEQGENTRFSLVRCIPETGRMHQIRVHLAWSGFPIVGDKIYGPDEGNYLEFIETGWTPSLASRLLLDRHALHAQRLTYGESSWESPLAPDLHSFIPVE